MRTAALYGELWGWLSLRRRPPPFFYRLLVLRGIVGPKEASDQKSVQFEPVPPFCSSLRVLLLLRTCLFRYSIEWTNSRLPPSEHIVFLSSSLLGDRWLLVFWATGLGTYRFPYSNPLSSLPSSGNSET